MYELRVVGTYRHFQAKTSETDVTRTFNVHWSQWRNQDFILEGLELWERASRYYRPLFLLKSNRTWKHFPTYAASNLAVLRMGRLHIYSFIRGPLRKVDVAKGTLWQQFHLEAL